MVFPGETGGILFVVLEDEKVWVVVGVAVVFALVPCGLDFVVLAAVFVVIFVGTTVVEDDRNFVVVFGVGAVKENKGVHI